MTYPQSVLLTFLVFFSGHAFAALFDNPQDLPNHEWDFIVVGGGTAGSVIASRLTEDPGVSVLLIEAGISNTGPGSSIIQTPFLVSEAGSGSMYDWNYTMIPQKALDNRTIQYPRGYVLGGSSSTNYMVYTRGSRDEYSRIAAISGDSGWTWENMYPFILKNEKHVPPSDNHNTTGEYNPVVHGYHGPLMTSLPGYLTDIDSRVINSTSELSSEFPFNLDMNSGNPLGIGWLQSTVGNGARSSSATAYLPPAISNRTNLSVLIQTRVTKLVVNNGTVNALPTIQGVEFAQHANGSLYTAMAGKEVILSAGSIGTPQILMLSGIGDPGELKRLNISTLVELPDIGKNLQEQPYFTMPWVVNSTQTFDSYTENATLFAAALAQYADNHTGIMSSNSIANQIGFFRLPNDSDILKKYGDPSAGPLSPHYEFAFSNGFVGTEQTPPTTGNYFTPSIMLVSPTSRGSVNVSSSSVFDSPIIDPQMLSTDFDLDTMVAAVDALHRFLSASPWRGYLVRPYTSAVNTTNTTEIISYIRRWIVPIRHPTGTARISKLNDETGVVGPDLLVKKMKGLRVVDASVIPVSVGCHPQAVVYAIAERASSLIKVQYSLS